MDEIVWMSIFYHTWTFKVKKKLFRCFKDLGLYNSLSYEFIDEKINKKHILTKVLKKCIYLLADSTIINLYYYTKQKNMMPCHKYMFFSDALYRQKIISWCIVRVLLDRQLIDVYQADEILVYMDKIIFKGHFIKEKYLKLKNNILLKL